MRERLAAFAALGAVLILSACTTGQATPAPSAPSAPTAAASPTLTPPPSTGEAWKPHTPFEAVLNRLQPDGHLSKEDALTAFATVVGPLPGVDASFDPTGVRDGTFAILEATRYRGQLSSDQEAAIDSYLAASDQEQILVARPVKASRQIVRLAVAPKDPLLQALDSAKDQFRAEIAAHVGDFPGDIRIHFDPQPEDQPRLLGQAWSDWPGGDFNNCDVYLFPHATTAEPLVMLNTLAHEMFHCFQFAGYGTVSGAQAAPAWVIEGQAEWVGNVVGGVDASDYAMWERYLTMPQIPLTQRAYDAIGFYSHLAETGIDPWTVFRPMWTSGSNSIDAFRTTGADQETFLTSWASSVFREPQALGPAWDTTGPGITPDKYAPPRLSIANGNTLDLSIAFFENDGDFAAVSADLLHVQVEGHGRLSDGSTDTTALADSWFCIAGIDCTCPNGDPLPVPIAGTLAGDVAFAMSGGTDGTVATATGVSRDDLCKQTPAPTVTPPPTPKPSDDQFCTLFRQYLAWAETTGGDINQPIAAEIARRFTEMQPVAPAELLDDVNLYVRVYGKFATEPEPINVPIVGPEAVGIGNAFLAMSAYCGVKLQ